MGERNSEEGLYFVAAEPIEGCRGLEDRHAYMYLHNAAAGAYAHVGADHDFDMALTVEEEGRLHLSEERSCESVVALC